MSDEKNAVTESEKGKALAGTLWSILERYSYQGISFVVMILMARVLTPEVYGLVGMITIFIYVAQSLVDSGFSQALIRKLDHNETDDSTAFYFNIIIGSLLYLLLWFLAPQIALFYDQPILIPITRIVCTAIIFNSLSVVQRALFTIEMNFKVQAKATLIASLISGGAGITMAYTGYGVWSIVAYQFINSFLNCVLLWQFSSWRPKWIFSWHSFRQLFNFGYKLALSGLIQTLYSNAYIMVIGKAFQATELGLYTRATQFVNFLSNNLSAVLQRVSYPVLCKYQNDTPELAMRFLKFLRIISFVMFVLMMGLAGVAKPLILSLLNPEWLSVAIYIQILSFALMWHWVYSINLNILLVKGRSDLFLRLEIIKKAVFIGVLFSTLPFGLIVICWGQVFNAFVEVGVNSFYTGRILGIGIWRQIKELAPSILISMSMGVIVYLVTEIMHLNSWANLFIGMAAGISYLSIISLITRNSEFIEILRMAGNKLKRTSV